MQYDTIDRTTPTLEPDEPVLFHQDWKHLLFLHWEVPVGELQKMLPPDLTVDTHEGKAYVGLLPFTLEGVRPVFTPPVPWLSSFHEVNLRTYVHHKGGEPGVFFFSLDASSSVAVTLARATYKLPYFYAPIDFAVSSATFPEIRFAAKRDDARSPHAAHGRFTYRPIEGPSFRCAPGTIEYFLVERYVLYAYDDHRLYRARVHHAPYVVSKAEVAEIDETLLWAAGIKRSQKPDLIHYSPGVSVKIYPLVEVNR